jgi:hypothetical protein
MASGGKHALEYLANARPSTLRISMNKQMLKAARCTYLSLPKLATASRSIKTKLPPRRTMLRA